MLVVKPDISAPSSPRAKDSPSQYICTGEGNTLLSSPSVLWGVTRLFRRVELGVSQQSEEPMTQQHIVRRPGSYLRQIGIQNMLCNCVFWVEWSSCQFQILPAYLGNNPRKCLELQTV